MSNNYSEQIFQSIDTIILQRLNEVSFDKTEICKIVSQNKDYPDRYWVSNDAGLKYEAYSTDANRKYLENQKVYVTIPQGDYSYRKLIIGAYSADEIPKNLYTNPFNNLAESNSIPFKLNSGLIVKTNSSSIASATIDDLEFSYNNVRDFDYIGLDFSFDTTAVEGYQGTYYLRLSVWGRDKEDKPLRLTQENDYSLIISSKNLYGNPYYLTEQLSFQHLFPWPINSSNKKPIKSTDIRDIKLELFTDKNFKTADQSIVLKKAVLKFGYDVKDLKEDKLQLILQEGQNIKYNVTISEDNTRTLYLEWQHLDSSKIPYIFNATQGFNNIFSEAEPPIIYWLHYIDGSGSHKDKDEKPDLPDDVAYNWQNCDALTSENMFYKTITLQKKYLNDQYKVVIKYKHSDDKEFSYAVSNAIIFESATANAAPGAGNVSGDSLKLTLGSGDTGIYNAYGLDGMIVNSRLKGPHTITASFFDGMEWIDVKNVKWEIPQENTMIESSSYDSSKKQQTIEFYIKNCYRPGAMNNRIWCYAELQNGEIRSGSLTLQFGEASTNGSIYAFNIDFVGNRNFLFFGPYADEMDKKVDIKVTFTKSDGSEVTTPPENIEWGWVHSEGAIEKYIEDDGTTYNYVEIISSDDSGCVLKTIADDEFESYQVERYCGILKATIKNYYLENGLQSDLVAYLPVPLVWKGENDDDPEVQEWFEYISGTTRVIYDFDNRSFTQSNETYRLYTNKKEWVTGQHEDQNEDVLWYINSFDEENPPKLQGKTVTKQSEGKTYIYYKSGCSLRPQSYEKQTTPKINISAYKNNGEVFMPLYWCQPILILSNRWGSDTVNDWDGKFYLDNSQETGHIKSPFFVAGKKDEGNTLTGLVIGDLQKADLTNSTGIYGFQKGKPAYFVTDDGKFFVGDTNNNTFISFNEGVDGRSGRGELYVKGRLEADQGRIANWELGAQSFSSSVTFKDTKEVNGQNVEYNRTLTTSIFSRPYYWHDADQTRAADVIVIEDNKYSSGNERYPFSLWRDGTVNCNKLNATGGKIASWTIEPNAIYYGNEYHSSKIGLGTRDPNFAFWAGTYKAGTNKDGTPYYNSNFRVSEGGYLHSEEGDIGGWKMDSVKMYCPCTKNDKTSAITKYGIGMCSAGMNAIAFWAGYSGTAETPFGEGDWASKTKFYVTHDGILNASGVKISGTITCDTITATTGGNIGGWSIVKDNNSNSYLEYYNYNGKRWFFLAPQSRNVYCTDGTSRDCVIGVASDFYGDTGNFAVGIGVTGDGFLYANNATIKGTLQADTVVSSGVKFGESKGIEINESSGGVLYIQHTNPTVATSGVQISAGWTAIACSSAGAFVYINNRGSLVGTWTDNSGIGITSDQNYKNSIGDIDDKYEAFFNDVKPRTYKYNDGTSNRIHTGFIAQEVEEAILNNNLTTQDLAITMLMDDLDVKTNISHQQYYLRYNEFIALNTWQIQKLKARVEELENEIKEIKQNETN